MSGRGILLTNLGTPDSPTEASVSAYLNEFLMDEWVISLPYPLRRLLVSLILRRRPAQTARAYQQIWTEQGSPLLSYCNKTANYLRDVLDLPVAVAMRYGNPTFTEAREVLQAVDEVLVISPYPQYAESTTRSLYEHAERVLTDKRLFALPPYYDDTEYVDANIEEIQTHIPSNCEHLVISFHGIPLSHLKKADPTQSHCRNVSNCCSIPNEAHVTCYRHQCLKTAEAIAAKIDLPTSVSFSSRLGRDKWLEPYTANHLIELGSKGLKYIAVVSPSFICDNLETLFEIGIEGRELFLNSGGQELTLIPSLNMNPRWLNRIKEWCESDANDLITLTLQR